MRARLGLNGGRLVLCGVLGMVSIYLVIWGLE